MARAQREDNLEASVPVAVPLPFSAKAATGTSEPEPDVLNGGQMGDATLVAIDPRTGAVLTPDEAAYRVQIVEEQRQGFYAIDPAYRQNQAAIHQPLEDETGTVVDGTWVLDRTNQTTLRIRPGEIGDLSTLPDEGDVIEKVGVLIAQKAINEYAARVMAMLYELANDPPNYRNPEFTIRVGELLDRMGYKRDERGVHRSDNRRRLTSTILALHFTHIGLQREEDGERVGVIAPLLSSLEYRTREPTGGLNPIQVFEQGLPDRLTITINRTWYRLRDAAGRPTSEYVLVPRTSPRLLAPGAPVGRRPNPVASLRAYITASRDALPQPEVILTGEALRAITTITDSNASRCAATLTRALDRLCREDVLRAYAPRPLPLDPHSPVVLQWDSVTKRDS